MNWQRMMQHLRYAPRHTRRLFPPQELTRLTEAISQSELGHRGEIRLIIEGSFGALRAWSGVSARARALELFSLHRVWDTEQNTGILVYLQLAERRLEIVADRGISRRVPQAVWDEVCHDMTAALAAGEVLQAVQQGLQRLTALLAEHFPPDPHADNEDELANAPLIL